MASSSSYRSNGGGGHHLESGSGRQYHSSNRGAFSKTGPARHHLFNYYGKRPHPAIDVYLRERSLKRKYIAKDGCCLFRAVAEQVLMYI